MNKTENRRRAPRLRYRVTVHYSDNTESGATAYEGQMLDISSGGLAFRCNADENCPYEGQQLNIRFSIPNSKVHDASMMDFNRTGQVLRVQEVNSTLWNVAVRFDEPLPVGKVFFDTIGLYHSNSENQDIVTDNNADEDNERSLGMILDQRIKELERELAQLKRLQLKNAQFDEME
ncbi:MAG: PilZ domain-containing protein [Sedimentisphaerales bacterium]|nr:PilZ domain-containing protein [Sedimentisphaerales bacterium]